MAAGFKLFLCWEVWYPPAGSNLRACNAKVAVTLLLKL